VLGCGVWVGLLVLCEFVGHYSAVGARGSQSAGISVPTWFSSK